MHSVFLVGLSLELYVEQDEYMELLTDSAGIRLMIHNQTSMPFPEDQGLSVRPGTKTFVGIKKVGINSYIKQALQKTVLGNRVNTVDPP